MYGNYQGYGYPPNYSNPNYMQRAYAQQSPQIAPQQAQAPNPIQMPTQTQIAPQTPQIQEIRYGTEEEAKAFIVFPNCIAYFIDAPKNRLYAKSANPSGISSIDYFSLTAINADGSPIKAQEPTPQINLDDYIKRQDLEKLGFVNIDQFNTLSQKLEQIQKKLEGAKANVGTTKQPETRV